MSISHGQGSTSLSTKLKSRFSFVPTAQLYGVFMGQISFFTSCRITCHIELGRLGGLPPTALLQSVYVHIFLVRCTIIASTVKYTCCGTPFRNSPLYVYVSLVPAAKKTQCGSITNTRRLTLLVGLFSENHIPHISMSVGTVFVRFLKQGLYVGRIMTML